jgi:endo-1,4-beta-xylanase
MDSGFQSAVETQTTRYFSLTRLAICVLVLAAVGWYLVSTYRSAPSGAKRESIAQTSEAAQTLRAMAAKHHLQMGAAASSSHLSQTPYASTLAREYSELEPADEMKFDAIHPEPDAYDFAGPDALVAFAQTNSMKVRGHTLIWHRALPSWILVRSWMQAQNGPSAPWTPKALNKILAEHIATLMSRYRGKIYAWDVVNEPFDEDGSMRSSIWYEKPGIGFAGEGTKYIEQALIWAHAADPDAKLFVNEFSAETMNKKSDAMYEMAKDFRSRGVPLNGIGLQLHLESDFNSFDSLRRNIHRLAELGLEVQFTEVDVRLRDDSDSSLRAEAEIYKNLLESCLGEPACTLFQTWGFTDAYSWIPEAYPGFGWALPFDPVYRKKPAYDAMLKTLQSHDNTELRPRSSRENHSDLIPQYRTALHRRERMGE